MRLMTDACACPSVMAGHLSRHAVKETTGSMADPYRGCSEQWVTRRAGIIESLLDRHARVRASVGPCTLFVSAIEPAWRCRTHPLTFTPPSRHAATPAPVRG